MLSSQWKRNSSHIVHSQNCKMFGSRPNVETRAADSRIGFLTLSTVDALGLEILCSGGYPVHYRMFSSIPRLYTLDANGCPPDDNQNIFRGYRRPGYEPLV